MGTGKCAAGYFSPSVRASSKLQPPLILRERLQLIYSVFNPGTALRAPPQTFSFLLRCDDEFQLLLSSLWFPLCSFQALQPEVWLVLLRTAAVADPVPPDSHHRRCLIAPRTRTGREGGGVSRGYALIPVCLALWSSRTYNCAHTVYPSLNVTEHL